MKEERTKKQIKKEKRAEKEVAQRDKGKRHDRMAGHGASEHPA